MVRSGLIGHTGLVGQNIVGTGLWFGELYNSSNIGDIRGKEFDLLVCAGARGNRRLGNQNPDEDLKNIRDLTDHLSQVKIKQLILVSTTEVYNYVNGINEDYPLVKDNLPPYSLHRVMLEEFCREHFKTLVVRLPIIFGKGLKKNFIYDLFHGQYDFTNRDNLFQFYDLKNILRDMNQALRIRADTVNFVSEPIPVKELAKDLFNAELTNTTEPLRQIDVSSKHWKDWGDTENYLYSKEDIYNSIREYQAKNPL